MNLKSLTKDFKTLSIIGMCKNAGKTTALNLLLNQSGLAVTSVGKDGETVDAVTKTPKPQVYVKQGTLVATASSLLSSCSVSREIICSTGISSPIGEIVIFKCIDHGFVEIAGPSITSQLTELKEHFFRLGATKIIIDGALNRRSISSAKIADASILSTGASYNKNMQVVIDDTAFVLDLYSLPTLDFEPNPTTNIEEALHQGKTKIFTPGALSESLLKKISTLKKVKDITIGVADASKILASKETVYNFLNRGGKIQTQDQIKIVAVTVNPYSAYGWHFDKNEFKKQMQNRTTLPVIDATEEN